MRKFSDLHPTTNLLFFMVMILFSMSTNHPILFGTSLISAMVFDLKLRKLKSLKSIIFFILPTSILIVVINFLFSHHGVDVLFVSNSGVNYTLQSLVSGVVSAVKISTLMLWFFSMGEILNEDKVLHIFGKVTPKIALVISMSLRFIPLISQQYSEISTAQKCLGKGMDGKNFAQKLKLALERTSILITWQLEKAVETSNSMSARGYELKGKTRLNNFKFKAVDVAFCIACVCTTVLVLTFIFKGSFETLYTPIIMLQPLTIGSIFVSVLWFMLGLSPTILESKK